MVPTVEFHLLARLGADQVRTSLTIAVRLQPQPGLGAAGQAGGHPESTTQGRSARHARQASSLLVGSLDRRDSNP